MHEFYKNPDGSDIFGGQIVGRTNLCLELESVWAFAGAGTP